MVGPFPVLLILGKPSRLPPLLANDTQEGTNRKGERYERIQTGGKKRSKCPKG